MTDTKVVERTPSFSPNGNKPIFAAERFQGEPGHIFTIKISGEDRTRLILSTHSDYSPSYSPGGGLRIVKPR